jgi:nitrile hydratase subunit alpha
VLADFNRVLPETVKIKVWDSTAEMRYLVLPMQPPESFGLPENELQAWVPRDAMIGTGFAQAPGAMA